MERDHRPSRDDLERAILGGEPTYASDDVADTIGVPMELAQRLWRALGFPEPGGQVAFTESDAKALRTMKEAIDREIVSYDTALKLTRGVGQTMARLADWEVASLLPVVDEMTTPEESRLASALELVRTMNGPFEELLVYAWRRHLAAAVSRVVRGDDDEESATEVTVGFADLVSFTALSNEMDEDRIGDLVEIFESRCHDVIAVHGGRAIKSLGDSVLFVSDSPVRAIEIAEGIINVIGRDSRLPDVRLGLASGSVVMRLGDVFGPPVNLAARLTAVARRNRVIIDDATAAQLSPEEFETRRLPARPVRGFGLVEPVAVRRH